MLAAPFAYAGLLKRGVRKQRHDTRHFLSRFGCVARSAHSGGYFFHCVSVGEVVAASCVIKALLQTEPGVTITITTTTPTGSARVRAIFGDQVHHFYLPFDFPFSMRWMLSRVKPCLVCITEVELWPNLIHACWKKKIPTVVINARMTDRSAARYQKISALFAPMLRKVSMVCAQGQRDYENYKALGIQSEKLTLTNNIKFDQAVSLDNSQNSDFMGLSNTERYIVVAGSTHEPEEQILLDAVQRLQDSAKRPKPLLIIVPRHPERFESVSDLLSSRNETYVRTSHVSAVNEHTNVILLDEMGRLNEAYAVADVAFVGGSLADKGGHNALEPAAFGIPVIMGPNTYNNPVICEYMVASGGLHIKHSAAQISEQLLLWLSNPAMRHQAGDAAKTVLTKNSGALNKTLHVLESFK
ncbi:3-deoxy-D-manno-octulosonic acid transferase [Salinimonas sp. HHU 13199]|uniref:3-deoxy-D-manno-octulosonic acid transferase n=2 Tax=Salinimonas profundi TaxID=2729140 RepID=A0ABR8LP97_9ALTE|nr:3-deoxy-D-manno-octulosonic acid transferase [Salinimonas profundi]